MDDQNGEGDYSIKFPTSRNVKWLDREPVVFLFGWAGCKKRYLDKYVQLYNLQGCATYQFTCPNEILFWRQERLQGLVETMADEFFESGYGEHPILFHVFSNGGCYVLLRFLQYFQNRQKQQQIAGGGGGAASKSTTMGEVDLRGLVFDSSPARGDGWTRAQAMTEALYGNYRPLVKRLLAGALGVVFTLWNWYRSTINWIRGRPSPTVTHPYETLPKFDLRCPMLFIYSKADEICKYQSIEAFLEKQRQRGVQVTQIRFNDSPHCQHGRRYPNEYNEAVKKFLYETMPDTSSSSSTSSSKKTRSKSGDNENVEGDFVKLDDNGGDKSESNEADDFELADN